MLSENWIENVEISSLAQEPVMTTLKFGNKQIIHADIACIAIQVFKPHKGKEYGKILFGVYDYISEQYEFIDDFFILVEKDVIDFFTQNYKKIHQDFEFYQIIQDKFGLDIEVSPSKNEIFFNFVKIDENYTIDFSELAQLVFKRIGLVG